MTRSSTSNPAAMTPSRAISMTRTGCRPPSVVARRAGFTLVDVLATISVIAVLIGLLVPGLAGVTESARRVACQSNVRQIGLALVMYTNDYNGQLPRSRYVLTGSTGSDQRAMSAEKMVALRVPAAEVDQSDPAGAWDGLGLLYHTEYLDASKVFYCPSHRGETSHAAYARAWTGGDGEIISNFHFRGQGPTTRRESGTNRPVQTTVLWNIDPSQSSLIADSMRSQLDYNHPAGVNFFRADLSVHWFDDPLGAIRESLPESKDQPGGGTAVSEAWNALDVAANNDNR